MNRTVLSCQMTDLLISLSPLPRHQPTIRILQAMISSSSSSFTALNLIFATLLPINKVAATDPRLQSIHSAPCIMICSLFIF